jgi:hypothetical protein
VLDREGLVYTKIELARIGEQSPVWWDTGARNFSTTS